jgi:hypothetical protein
VEFTERQPQNWQARGQDRVDAKQRPQTDSEEPTFLAFLAFLGRYQGTRGYAKKLSIGDTVSVWRQSLSTKSTICVHMCIFCRPT